MTYTEYRNSFKNVDEFRKAFGQLSEDEAKAIIAADSCPNFIKACIITTWRSAHREWLKNSKDKT